MDNTHPLIRFLRSLRKERGEDGKGNIPQILGLLLKFSFGMSFFLAPVMFLLYTELGQAYAATYPILGALSNVLNAKFGSTF